MSTPVVVPVAIIRNIGGFTFDAVIKEDHERKAEITDDPVETGVSVSDHAYMKPYKVVVTAGVGDAPIDPNSIDLYAGTSRAQVAFQLLTELQESFEPFSVQTGLALYENMLIEALRTSQDKDTSGSFIFEAELKSVNIVSTQTIQYPPRAKSAHQASSQVNRGQQQGTEVSDAEKKASMAAKVLSWLREAK